MNAQEKPFDKFLSFLPILRQATVGMEPPMVVTINREYGRNPFLILISCLLSLRAKDSATLPICRQLFNRVQTPHDILKVSVPELEKLLYSLGFYRKKALLLHAVCHELIDRFSGVVPNTSKELISIKGVGEKTANLVLGEGFNIPAICVDIHVHRISNRLGLVSTTTPEQTQRAPEKIIPEQYWIEWNHLLVMWGQNICVPVSPLCSKCPVFSLCERVGVTKSR